MNELDFILSVGIPAVLVTIAIFTGRWIERAHLRSLAEREAAARDMTVTNLSRPPAGVSAQSAFLCVGSAVISVDYFRQMISRIRKFFGGRFDTVARVLDRGRREALLRMIEKARRGGATHVINVRLETSTIMRGEDESGGMSAEVVAYGTALRTAASTASPSTPPDTGSAP